MLKKLLDGTVMAVDVRNTITGRGGGSMNSAMYLYNLPLR